MLDDGTEAGAWMSLTIAAHELIYVADALGARGRLHHLAFWVDTREEVLRAADIFIEHDVHVEAAPSKHTIAQGFFLYGIEPGGNRIEVTSGGYLVYDPDAEPVVWSEAERARGQAWGVKTVESFHSTARHRPRCRVPVPAALRRSIGYARLRRGRASSALAELAAGQPFGAAEVQRLHLGPTRPGMSGLTVKPIWVCRYARCL